MKCLDFFLQLLFFLKHFSLHEKLSKIVLQKPLGPDVRKCFMLWSILTKPEFPRQVLIKAPNIKLHESLPSGSRDVPYEMTDRQTDGRI